MVDLNSTRTHTVTIQPNPRKSKERFMVFWEDYSWIVIGILWIVVLVLGFVGFSLYLKPQGEWNPSTLDILYRTIQLVVLESGAIDGHAGWPFEIARFLAPPLAALTALKAFSTILRDRLRLVWLKWFCRNHTIICGLGRKGLAFSVGLLERREPVVVIEKDEGNEFIAKCKELGGIVLIGDARDRLTLQRARLDRSQTLVCACGLDETNAEIALQVRELTISRADRHLLALVHIFSPHICNLLSPLRQQMSAASGLRLEWFSMFHNGAWAMLNRYRPFSDEPAGGTNTPHVLVVGVGWLGQSLVVQAAKKWKRHRGASVERLRITVVDKEAQRIVGYLSSKYPGLNDICEFTCWDSDVESQEFQDGAFLRSDNDWAGLRAIYVCIDNPELGLEAALSLASRTHAYGIPVVTRVDDDTGIAALMKAGDCESSVYCGLAPFPLINETCHPDIYIRLQAEHITASYHGSVMIERLAPLLHSNYLNGQIGAGKKMGETPALVEWDDLPEVYKNQNREQARDLYGSVLLPTGFSITPLTEWEPEPIEFSDEELEDLARREHERWLRSKLADGWTYAPIRDEAKKQGPHIVPYDELDESMKEYNRNFFRKLPDTLAAVDYELYRVGR